MGVICYESSRYIARVGAEVENFGKVPVNVLVTNAFVSNFSLGPGDGMVETLRVLTSSRSARRMATSSFK
jgi:hypothetical protein